MQASRRAFFGIRSARAGQPIRPPWALAEAQFVAVCTRCSACRDACPTGLLVQGDGGFPEADFTPGRAVDGCTFCGDCLKACPEQALQQVPGASPWSLVATFGASCLASRDVVCRTCGESCPSSAIRFPPRLGGVSRPVLDSAACNGCGACLADCPTTAISVVADSLNPSALRGNA